MHARHVELDRLMHTAWPGLTNVPIDSWIARLAGGVTQRANSVLPIGAPRDIGAAIEAVERLYREHDLPPQFQISPAAQPPGLDAVLAERGYESRSPTLVHVANVDSVPGAVASPNPPVRIAEKPDKEWVRLWWSVDGRGGVNAETIALQIMVSCPSLYVSIHDGAGLAAVGRIAIVGSWGGIYCMAVRMDARRQGYGQAIVSALLRAGKERGVERVWLQVVEANHAARALYERCTFAPVSSYHYRKLPL